MLVNEPNLPVASVVVPNWNGVQHLPECLTALASQTFDRYEVIVVDNGSTDESLTWLQANAPHVRVIARGSNDGFSAAVNDGVAAARGDYVALLNNDTAPDAEWLSALVTALELRPSYDIAASLMVFYAEPERVNAAGDVYHVWQGMGGNRGFGESVDRYESSVRVFGACAGAALYRSSIFSDVGPFDEQFFLGSEDTDFNVRALIAGKKALFVPAAKVRHKLGASRNAVRSWRLERIEIRNNGIVLGRDMPWGTLVYWVLTWPIRIVRDIVAIRPSKWAGLSARVKRTFRSLPPTADGIRIGLRSRRDVWRRQAVSTSEIRWWLRHGVGPAD